METSQTKEENYQMVAKTFAGLEEVLAKELVDLGASGIEKQNRAVVFNGNKAMMYRANYRLRTALSILKPIASFKAADEDALYKEVSRISWGDYMDVKETLAISTVAFSNTFKHTKYVSLKVKDAIVDQFRRRKGERPNVDTIEPDLRIHVHIAQNDVTLLLDSSGDTLFKRGYRQQGGKAPLNEVLAAGMILLSGWDCKSHFFDPMCGSGTLLIEAAMIAHGIAPGTYRSRFGFENWNDFDADLFESVTEETVETPDFEYTISGSDLSPGALKIAEANIKAAFLSKKINVKARNFFDTKPIGEKGIIITNPPYGERLQPDDLRIFYQKIGDKLKLDYPGYDAWLIGSNVDVLKFVGLKPEKKIKLFNGPLECSFRKYSLYEGSGKTQPEELK
jgi:putative N6-adenine-specific DNA methylase